MRTLLAVAAVTVTSWSVPAVAQQYTGDPLFDARVRDACDGYEVDRARYEYDPNLRLIVSCGKALLPLSGAGVAGAGTVVAGAGAAGAAGAVGAAGVGAGAAGAAGAAAAGVGAAGVGAAAAVAGAVATNFAILAPIVAGAVGVAGVAAAAGGGSSTTPDTQ